jgi:aryl carrier-like protein
VLFTDGISEALDHDQACYGFDRLEARRTRLAFRARCCRSTAAKHQFDAANFSKVELILQARDLMPFAIQMYKPAGQDRDVYQFDPRTNLIDRGLDMIRDFAKPMTPFGYKYVLEDLQAQPAGPPAAAGTVR